MASDEAVAHQSNNGVCSTPANPFAVPPHFSQPPGLKRPAQEGRLHYDACTMHRSCDSQLTKMQYMLEVLL